MNSILKLYNTKLIKDKHMMVDEIDYYLSTLTPLTYNDYQFIKHDRRLSIKICASGKVFDVFTYNYVSIQNRNNGSNYGMLHFYFITHIEYIAVDTIKLDLELDLLNTFNYAEFLDLDNRSITYREHRDRIKIDSDSHLLPIVDEVDENINVGLITSYDEPAVIRRDKLDAHSWDMKWYIVIQYCKIKGNIAYIHFIPQYDIAVKNISVVKTSISGTVILGGINRFPVNDSKTYKVIECPYCPLELEYDSYDYVSSIFSETSPYTILDDEYTMNNPLPSGNYMIFKSVIPYRASLVYRTDGEPFNEPMTDTYRQYDCHTCLAITYQSDATSNFYQITDFLKQLSIIPTISNLGTIAPTSRSSHNSTYETKLYNSAFYFDKYLINNNEFILKNELIDFKYNTKLIISYYQSASTGKGLFRFNINTNVSPFTNLSRETQDNKVICFNGNEWALLNDNYLNYMRNGYNFDKTSRDMGLVSNIIGGITGIATGVGAGMLGSAGGALKGVSGGTSSLLNTPFSYMQAEENIEKNKKQALAQGINVSSGSNDVEFNEHFTNGQLGFIHYDLDDYHKNFIYNLFRLKGYKTDMIKAPNIDNRRNYNYIECEPYFVDEASGRLINYIDDLKTIFRNGITIFHKAMFNGSYGYDFEQAYENWETFILARNVES